VTKFTVGERYTNEEVYRSLGVGNAGGIRPNVGKDGEIRRLVVMTTTPDARNITENPYHDRVEGDVLIYTAAGLEGDQSVGGINKRLVEQFGTPFPVYGFSNTGSRRDRSLGPNRWEFLGLLQYVRHYKELQVDARQNARVAWVFEMLIHQDAREVTIEKDWALSVELLKSRAGNVDDEADRVIARKESDLSTGATPAPVIETESVRRQMLALPPAEFEQLIKNVLQATGFEKATVTRYSKDGGIDVNAYVGEGAWAVRGLHVQVQAKRWLHTVGRKEVAELRGSIEPLARGAVVTTGFFSKAAVAEASGAGKSPIVLVDGSEFASIVARLKMSLPRMSLP
jgi:hypothetical protein